MKSLILSLVMLAGSSAMANDFVSYEDFAVTDYYSWCDQNNVVSQDKKGDLYVVTDCTAEGLTCETKQLYRAKRLIVVASCQAK